MDPRGVPNARMCYLLAFPASGLKLGGVCDIPASFWAAFNARSTQIIAAELLTPLVCFFHEWRQLRGALVTAYIDNMSGLCMLVSGTARARDLSACSFATHLGLTLLGCRVWWEYVDSAANSADGGSRNGVLDAHAAALGFALRRVALPALPANFPFSSFQH